MIAHTEWTSADPNPSLFLGRTQSGQTIGFDTASPYAHGPSPMEAVLMALCGCTSVDVVGILKKKRQPLDALTVSAVAEQAAEPPRVFTKILLTYSVLAEPGKQLSRKAVEDAVHLSKTRYCSVSAMLGKSAEIDFSIEFGNGDPLP